jgi:hypothetical protein
VMADHTGKRTFIILRCVSYLLGLG